MSARISRLSESSSQSESEDPVPLPPPKKPKPSVAPIPKTSKSLEALIAKAEQLEKQYSNRYTSEDPGYNENMLAEALPPPVIPEYKGNPYRGGGGRGGGGGHGGGGGGYSGGGGGHGGGGGGHGGGRNYR